MSQPLVVRLLLDAEHELGRVADAIPEASRDTAGAGLNAPGWIVAHAAAFLDLWLSADAQGQDFDACDAWLVDWFRRQEASAGPIETPFADAREALDRAAERTSSFLAALSDSDLEQVPPRIEENGWPADTRVGYLVARSAAHLFAHASELNVLATAAGAPDMGLPGRLTHTRG
jgi:hypothetical protein